MYQNFNNLFKHNINNSPKTNPEELRTKVYLLAHNLDNWNGVNCLYNWFLKIFVLFNFRVGKFFSHTLIEHAFCYGQFTDLDLEYIRCIDITYVVDA